jgi:hypothetical protein
MLVVVPFLHALSGYYHEYDSLAHFMQLSISSDP